MRVRTHFNKHHHRVLRRDTFDVDYLIILIILFLRGTRLVEQYKLNGHRHGAHTGRRVIIVIIIIRMRTIVDRKKKSSDVAAAAASRRARLLPAAAAAAVVAAAVAAVAVAAVVVHTDESITVPRYYAAC